MEMFYDKFRLTFSIVMEFMRRFPGSPGNVNP